MKSLCIVLLAVGLPSDNVTSEGGELLHHEFCNESCDGR